MPFSDNLRFYREKAGYSKAKDFAEKLGIAYGTYLPYENQGREPRYDMLVKIATLLNVSTDTLLDIPSTLIETDIKNAAFSSEELSLMNAYRKLDQRGKGTVQCIVTREFFVSHESKKGGD
ncbi:MAG: helix-turn-helix domain-containing protein [Proteocatella sp.]